MDNLSDEEKQWILAAMTEFGFALRKHHDTMEEEAKKQTAALKEIGLAIRALTHD